MWSKELAPLQYLDPELFVGKDDEERKVCAFILALALYFNDSKALVGMALRVIAEKPDLDSICEELGEYSALKNYLHRLIYAHIHELHYLLQQYLKEMTGIPLYNALINGMDPEPRKNWQGLISMSASKSDPVQEWFQEMRNGLGFHYVRHAQLYAGYLDWKASLAKGEASERQEGAYISLGTSVKVTRYYFADAAADFWMRAETKKLPNFEEALKTIMDRNVNSISGLINQFIKYRGGAAHKSAYPKTK